MSTGATKRSRSALQLPPGRFARLTAFFQRRDVMLRVGLALLAAVSMWAVTGGWQPPFAYQVGDVPSRNIVSRTRFKVPDPKKTEDLREDARRQTVNIYVNNPSALTGLRKELRDQVFKMIAADSYQAVDKQGWSEFFSAQEPPTEPEKAANFAEFKQALSGDKDLKIFEQTVAKALADVERRGLLPSLEHNKEEGDMSRIVVRSPGQPPQEVDVESVRIGEVRQELEQRLSEEFNAAQEPQMDPELVARRVFAWLDRRGWPKTLSIDAQASQQAREANMAAVAEQTTPYGPGDLISEGGKPLGPRDLELLHSEYEAVVAGMSLEQKISHTAADFGMYMALYVLCGIYIFYRERRLIADLRRFATVLGLVVATVAVAALMNYFRWPAEIVPLVMFGMTVAIAFQRELALLLASAAALVIVVSVGAGLAEFVILVAGSAATIQWLERIRTRTRLIYAGLCGAAVVILTTLGVGTLSGRAFGAVSEPGLALVEASQLAWKSYAWALLKDSLWNGFWVLMAAVLMTGLLPFVERSFDVQTDISLLELGDQRHPLLQELVRRAPGTYNHSINVASIGEAAAEAIGANGLLVRVGAYFHDIGKMLKPGYFVENQGLAGNRHESLVPAMSTLVIIAHVKDGSELAKKHGLPRAVIDFIEQHHGTTLVEYFFNRASQQSEAEPDRGEVDESSFRYPGPKPQTKEAAVMMLADAVESASRTLVEPTPSRIEGLVNTLAMKRLMDGQFDECGLTLKELATVEESLVKSVTAIYHGRVKYPEQKQPASA